ncbi:hypothetical protein KEM52_003995, partial [Ascosphaera acerosa]
DVRRRRPLAQVAPARARVRAVFVGAVGASAAALQPDCRRGGAPITAAPAGAVRGGRLAEDEELDERAEQQDDGELADEQALREGEAGAGADDSVRVSRWPPRLSLLNFGRPVGEWSA